ncbi:MAG: restriction endonuclease [Clostridia bacterium]|nr:restriction endonuclease [Clostridia bacterium]
MYNICAKNNSIDKWQILFFAVLIAIILICLVYLLVKKYKWSLFRIDRMNGHDFEEFMKTVYKTLGYKVEQTKKSGDQGIDLIIKKHFKKTGIQLKRYSNSVGNSAVQEAVAGKKFYKLDRVCVLTNRSFTKSAIELAKANKVELIDREDLKKLLKKAKKKGRK